MKTTLVSLLSQQLDDREIGNSVELERKNKQGEIIKNEFDILFIKNNTLHIIECKTEGVKKSLKKDKLVEYLNKIKSLKTEFGLKVPSPILTLGDFEHNKQDIPSILARAQHYGIQIYDRKLFTNPSWPEVL